VGSWVYERVLIVLTHRGEKNTFLAGVGGWVDERVCLNLLAGVIGCVDDGVCLNERVCLGG